jgi:hypothetical protein
MPIAPWVMAKEEQIGFLNTMAKLKLPLRYVVGLKKHIVNGKLGALKSHDYHILF